MTDRSTDSSEHRQITVEDALRSSFDTLSSYYSNNTVEQMQSKTALGVAIRGRKLTANPARTGKPLCRRLLTFVYRHIGHAFNSVLNSFKNRQSVPSVMSFCGVVLIMPTSCRRSA